MAGSNETISFKPGDLLDPLDAMLADKGLSRTEFFRQITAAAIVLHERGDDPIAILNKMPIGGLAAVERERQATTQLLVTAHKTLNEMQAAIGSLWPIVVGGGDPLVDGNSAEDETVDAPITLVETYRACEALTDAVHRFTEVWTVRANSLVEPLG
jgi:hypothetical protein